MSMFCYQCEQSAAPGGCTVQGVCGKTAPVANLQDELTAALVGLARALDVKGQTKEGVDYLMRGLFMCVTNVNFSEDRVQEFIDEVNAYHAKSIAQLKTSIGNNCGKVKKISYPFVPHYC